MCFNSHENVIYFVDGMKFENGQCYPCNDSLFCLDLDTKIVKPILSKCLSHCSDICYDNLSKAIYICEPFANRVTKAQIHKSGTIFSSIFHQFSGRLGPTSLAVDEFGNIYVSRFEFAVSINHLKDLTENGNTDGLISVLNTKGDIIGELYLPKLPEISSLFISSKRKDSLYFTERGCNSVMKIKLSNFVTDLEKNKKKS